MSRLLKDILDQSLIVILHFGVMKSIVVAEVRILEDK